MKIKPIHTDTAPAAIGTYSQAVQAGNTLYLSGQIPINPATSELITGNISEEIHQVFKNIAAVITAANGELKHIVKLNIFLTDLSHFSLVNEIMSEYFTEPYPARAAIGVAALPKNSRVEMDCIAVLPHE